MKTRCEKAFAPTAPGCVEPPLRRAACAASPSPSMRHPHPSKVLFASLLPFAAAVLGPVSALLAQEPEAQPAPKPDEAKAAEPAPPPAEGRPRRGGRRAQRTVVLEAAHVHPVSGAAIEDGVVVVRGDRIVAVGKRGEVEVPEGAEVIRYEGAHLYPGLVDADSDAFLDDNTRNDTSADPATSIAQSVGLRRDREDELVRAGITTAYVQNRRGNPWTGLGAVVRPKKDGVSVFPGKEKAGLGLLLAAPPLGTHALDRQRNVEGAFTAFAGLDGYKKQLDEHAKALEKYGKDLEAYLAFHRKKNGKEEPKPAADKAPASAPEKPAETPTPGDAPANGAGGDAPRAPGQRGQRGQRGGRRGGEPQPGGEPRPDQPKPDQPKPDQPKPDEPKPEQPKPDEPKPEQPKPDTPKPQEPKQPETKPDAPKNEAPKSESQKPQGEAKAEGQKSDEKGPERPKYPKAPDRDPVKDALLAVLDGEVPLRVQVRRADEVRTCLAMAKERKIPSLVLTDLLAAAATADELAAAGASCVLSGGLAQDAPEPFTDVDVRDLPQQLHKAGVAFAIASGSGRSGRALPLVAASAVGNGLDAEAALRAITLSAAEILGVQKDAGSLTAGKLADVLVTDRPLFASDSRVLAVWSAGAPQFESASSKESR